MTTLNSKLVRAQKKHRCDYCGGIIHEKELYKNTDHVYTEEDANLIASNL